MSDWEIVNGSQQEKPAEFDTTSSNIVVYQRRNIKEVELKTEDNKTYKQWQYEERTMSKREYEELYANNIISQLAQARADIDYLSAITETDL